MKKTLVCLLSVLLTLCLFIGCSSSPEEGSLSLEVEKDVNVFFVDEDITSLIKVYLVKPDKTKTKITEYTTNLEDNKIASDTTSVEVEYQGLKTSVDLSVKEKNLQSSYNLKEKNTWFTFTGKAASEITKVIFTDKKPTDITFDEENVNVTVGDNTTPSNGVVGYRDGTTIYIVGDRIICNEDSSTMFFEGGFEEIDFEVFDTSKVTDMGGMFFCCENLTTLKNIEKWNTSKVSTVTLFYGGSNYGMFQECSMLNNLDLSGWDTSNVADMCQMFGECEKLSSITFGTGWDTSNVTTMEGMFYKCESLTSLDLSNFDTSKVEDMSGMFQNCSELTELNLSVFNTSEVKDVTDMFCECKKLSSITFGTEWDTSSVTTMEGMFNMCESLTSLDLSNFDTSNVSAQDGMYCMFQGCKGLTSLDLSSFDTSKVTDISSMFKDCSGLTSLNLSNFDISTSGTRTALDTGSMFINCGPIDIKLTVTIPSDVNLQSDWITLLTNEDNGFTQGESSTTYTRTRTN